MHLNGSSHSRDGSNQAVTLTDRGGNNEPQVALTIVGAGGIQDAFLRQVNHQGVDGALVAAGIQTHGTDQIGAGLGTVLDQVGADGSADDGGEHRSQVVVRGCPA